MPNCYLYISRAMDRFDLAAHGEPGPRCSAALGLERALVIGVETDMLFSVAEQRPLAAGSPTPGSPRASRRSPASRGMTAFLIDIASFGAEIGAFLALS